MCQHFEHLDLQKGIIILSADKTEKHLYFVKDGLVRAFTDFEGQEVTFWFGTEGQPLIPMNNYVYNKKNYENIELLEDWVVPTCYNALLFGILLHILGLHKLA
ncbi:hypothetical protein [Soonwooa sp.]|nr:hypothetical protein [Soonwooa sp.]